MTLSVESLVGVVVILVVLNLLCLLALVGLVLVPRVRERGAVHTASTAKAEWASVDLLPRD